MTHDPKWERRLLSAWGRRATLFEESRTLIEEIELFRYLCELGRQWPSKAEETPKVLFAIAQQEKPVVSETFPQLEDESFGTYRARVSSIYGSEATLLYVRGAQVRSKSLRDAIQRLLAPAWAYGYRWKHIELEIYVGQYPWTAIGVHREECSNIHHVICGSKEMLCWRPRALAPKIGRPDRARYSSADEASRAGIIPEALRISASAGQAIYVPSRHWHVGISSQLSVALNISLYGVALRRL